MELQYRNLDATKAYTGLKSLSAKAISLKELLVPQRIAAYSIDAGGGLTYNYAAKKVTDEVLNGLQQLADEQQLIANTRTSTTAESPIAGRSGWSCTT